MIADSLKCIAILVLITAGLVLGLSEVQQLGASEYDAAPARRGTSLYDSRFDELWYAVCVVESDNSPGAIGDEGRALGIAQIHKIMVDDCNRIAGRERWSYDDRTDPQSSYEMFVTYLEHYGAGKSLEWCARAWNGGPTWEKRQVAVKNTAKYWARIQEVLRG